MSDRGWKQFERRCAVALGTRRIPVTGLDRNGADVEDGIACYQVKLRASIPDWLWSWLSGIRSVAEPKGKAGVLILKKPRMRDDEGLVVLTWAAWRDLHGPIDSEPSV